MSTRCPDSCPRVNTASRPGHQVTYGATRTTENRGQTTSEASSLSSVGTYDSQDGPVHRNVRNERSSSVRTLSFVVTGNGRASINGHDPSPTVSSCLEDRTMTREDARPRRAASPRVSEASRRAVTTSRATERSVSNEAHDPCFSECPTTRARDRAAKKVADRQRRLDEYLLGKGWGYFDEVCACSSMCLLNQLRNDPFVKSVLRSACFFAVGMKLCAELDAWHMVD